MALTRFLDNQIRDAIYFGSPITAGRGEFLALAGSTPDGTLVIYDMPRVPMPAFNEYLNQKYNATALTFTNTTDFDNYCSFLVCMSADDEPLFVIHIRRGVNLLSGETLTIPAESFYTETNNFIQENNLIVLETDTLPYRALTTSLQPNASLSGNATYTRLLVSGLASGSFSLSQDAIENVSISSNATASVNLSLDGDANGTTSVVLGSEIDSIDWEEGFDFTSIDTIDHNSYPTFGNPASSPEAGNATFNADPGDAVIITLRTGNSTSPLLSSGIGSSRVNEAVRIDDLLGFVLNDGPSNNALNLSITGPLHFRWLVTFPENTGSGTGNRVLNLFRVANTPSYRTWAMNASLFWDNVNSQRVASVSTLYRPTDNVNFTNEILNVTTDITSTVSDGDWVLMDVVVRENGSGNLQVEIMANGQNSSLDSSNSFSGPFEISQKDIAQFSTSDNASNIIFFGYRRSDYTLADHNAALTSLGL